MSQAIGFDVYGTLVNPLEMDEHLRVFAGEHAGRLAEVWREKQIEYSFRRGLMDAYEDFDVCTRQALTFAARTLNIELSGEDEDNLVAEYQNLQAFPDAAPALEVLKERGHRLVAFSNGVEETARKLLERAGLLPHLDDVVSVDGVKSFKPDPEVYRYLCRKLNLPPEEVWLASSNAWDVIGAKNAGLRAAWVRRRPDAVFDPWDVEPDLVCGTLGGLAGELPPPG